MESILSTRRGFGQGIPLTILPPMKMFARLLYSCVSWSSQGGHWSLLVIDRTEYEPGIFNRIPNASQSQTFTFPKCDILIWKRASDEMQFVHAENLQHL
jgi:hypothetical protein